MADLEKTINDLEEIEANMTFYKHPESAKTVRDALELLKEQQKKICEYEGLRKPKEPIAVMKIKKSNGMFGGYCPCCEGTVFSVYGNCPSCGQALLWMMDKYRKDGEQDA